MTPAGPTLNALLVATALEDWPAWYGCTRPALADYLEERDLSGDRLAAALVRAVLPTAWAQCPVRPGWEVEKVSLCRGAPAGPVASWSRVRVAVDGYGRGDDAFSALTYEHLWPGMASTVFHDCLRPFPIRALRLSAVIPGGSEVSAGVTLRPVGWTTDDDSCRWFDLKLTPRDARLWCRREVLGLFADVLVKARCPHCLGTGYQYRPHERPGVLPCPVCRGRPPRPCAAPSLLPTLPAVARTAPAPLH